MLDFIKKLGLEENNAGTWIGNQPLNSGDKIASHTPVDNSLIGTVTTTTEEEYEKVIQSSTSAFKQWRTVPAPKRGEIIRQLGNKLREYKEPLGKLVSYEMGKSLQEGYGEVQEMIDICDFAVGLSRQLYGKTMKSERPGHRMYEQWHPLGPVGIITAFNFPVAVWAWNSAIALVCGDVSIWKPSEKVPLCSVACQNILMEVLAEHDDIPNEISCIVNGAVPLGEMMTSDKRLPLISATGSIRMGRIVGAAVAQRLGKSILELGGNNAIIVSDKADLDLALPGIVFGAVGTAGQRCTTTRRLIVHEDVYDDVKKKLSKAYEQVKIGNPLDAGNHMGPLIDKDAVDAYTSAIEEVRKEGGSFLVEGGVLEGGEYDNGYYVKPCIAEVRNDFKIVQKETFAPILYLIKYSNLDDAIAMHNDVPQGLSSALMTTSLRESELFLSAAGSDCGIANVNIGTSGAEIGGAFGGEKETGGGRESGSDAWKAYMRRQTNTINYSTDLPLAQGIEFDL